LVGIDRQCGAGLTSVAATGHDDLSQPVANGLAPLSSGFVDDAPWPAIVWAGAAE